MSRIHPQSTRKRGWANIYSVDLGKLLEFVIAKNVGRWRVNYLVCSSLEGLLKKGTSVVANHRERYFLFKPMDARFNT